MTIRKKLLTLISIPVLLCTAIAVIISAVKIQNQGIENLIDKSRAILSLHIKEYIITHQTDISVFERDNSEFLDEAKHKEAQDYKFRIASPDPKIKKHQSVAQKIKIS
ncbi:MAG: hypothetical protein HC831_21850 [Chloroflexia bacterium]|nr:hypothetical protein [Chloroflexia bacterium]